MKTLILVIVLLGWPALTGVLSAASGVIPERKARPALAVKGKLLLEDDLRYPEEYTREFQVLKEGWRVKAWHATWERTGEAPKD